MSITIGKDYPKNLYDFILNNYDRVCKNLIIENSESMFKSNEAKSFIKLCDKEDFSFLDTEEKML